MIRVPKKQANGLYRARVNIGSDENGKSVYKYVSGRTIKELEEEKKRVIREHTEDAMESQRDILLSAYVQNWYNQKKEEGRLSVGGLETYSIALNKHILPLLGNRQMRAITAGQLQSLINGKAKEGLGASSINKIALTIKQIFRHATATGVLDRDPSAILKRPAAHSGTRRALTEQERTAAIQVGREHEEGLLLLVLLYLGLRIGEALGLMWTDFDWKERTVHIQRDVDYRRPTDDMLGTVKTPSSNRVIPVPDILYFVLRPLSGIGLVFPAPQTNGPLPQATLKRRWNRLMAAMYDADPTIEHEPEAHPDAKRRKPDRSGKPGPKPIAVKQRSILTAHYFRHDFASYCYASGVDVLTASKWLGHSDVKTTLGIYAHLSKEHEKADVAKINAAFSGTLLQPNCNQTFSHSTTSANAPSGINADL